MGKYNIKKAKKKYKNSKIYIIKKKSLIPEFFGGVAVRFTKFFLNIILQTKTR